MESLIIFIIIAIISSLFGKEKKQPNKKPTKQMPSFGQQTNPENSKPVPEKQRPAARSLEDFANEIFGQLNEKVEQKTEPRRQSVPVAPVPSKSVVESVQNTRPTFNGEQTSRSERPPLAERPLTKKLKEQELQVVPKTKQQLMQGIIMAEVLGAPKSKIK